MKDFLKRIKADFLLSSIFCIALGIVFTIWRGGVIDVIGSVLAFGLIIIGAVYLCSFFLKLVTNGFSVFMGIVVLAVGIWFLINPAIVVSLIPIAIGVVLIFHSIRGIVEAATAMKYEYKHLGVGIVMSVISLVLGVLCVVDAFGVMEKAIIVVGIVLIYNGIANIWIALSTSRAETVYKKNETIDVDFIDESEDAK